MKNNPEDIARVNSMLTDCVELKLHDVVCIVGADELRLMILTDSVGTRPTARDACPRCSAP